MAERIAAIYAKLNRAFGSHAWWPAQSAFEVLVGAVLTQNTAWRNVEKALANLRAVQWLTPAAILAAEPEALAQCLRPSGYYNVKAQRLRAACVAWQSLGGEAGARSMTTEALRTTLLAVKGLGPESVDDILLYGLQRPVFVVDAYTQRILSRLGVIDRPVPYAQLQALFHDALPTDAALFNDYHAQIVALGKDYCRPREPNCSQCPLSEDCRYAQSAV